jgi:hypothetical protein
MYAGLHVKYPLWSSDFNETLIYTTHKEHNRRTSMPPVAFEPATPANEQPQTYALHRTATGMREIIMTVSK